MELVVQSPSARQTLEVQPNDTVESLKKQINSTFGIPVKYQRLFLASKELEDGKSLLQSNIENGCTVNVGYSEATFSLFVKIYTGETIQIEAASTDRIEEIKMKVQHTVGTPAIFQSLVFAGHDMEDNRTLGDFNVQKESVLHMVPRKVLIFVDVEGGESCRLMVKHNDTVESIKNQMKKKVGMSADKECLLYCKRTPTSQLELLENSLKLAECNIGKSTTFEFSTCGSSSSCIKPGDLPGATPNPQSLKATDNEFLQKFSDTLQATSMMGHQFTFSGGEDRVFQLEECGIRIYVAKGTIPADSVCELAVLPIVAGSFVFPSRHKPVSGIYAIGASCSLLKPITIELQHCIQVTNCSEKSLKFAQAEHENISHPYEFKPCSEGRFFKGSSYCSLDCQSFTLYTVLVSIGNWFFGIPTVERYKAHLLYEKSPTTPRKWTVHFIVTKNLNKDIQLAIGEVPNLSHRSEIVFSFSGTEVVLEIAESSITVGGWEILPHHLPCKILRDDVDQVGCSNASLPKCSIDLLAKEDCTERLHYKVNIKGVTDPDLAIFLNCYRENEVATSSLGSSSFSEFSNSGCSLQSLSINPTDSLISRAQLAPITSEPTLKELISHVGTAAPDKFKLIGISLGMDLSLLKSIEQQHGNDPMECYVAMFDHWIKSESSQVTWENVFMALESDIVRRPDLARTVRIKLQNN